MNYLKEEKQYLSDNERSLATGKIGPLFRRFAIPGVVGLLFLGIQSIIDGLIVGNYLGANALASVSLILPGYTLMTALAIVIGIGSQTLVSIGFGEQNYRNAQDAMTTGYVSIVSLCVLYSAVFLFFTRECAVLLGANEVLISDSVDYIYGLVPFMPVVVSMFYCDYMLKAMGHPKFAVSIMTLAVFLNIGLDILFIACFGMGTFGAGLATGIAFSVGAVCAFFVVLNKRNVISLFAGRFRPRLLWQMFYNGSSEGLSEFAAGITILLFNITLMKYAGEAGVAAFTVINYIAFLGITVFLGISDGIVPIISYNFGAKRWDRIKAVLRLALTTNMTIGVVLFLVLVLFGGRLIALFFSSGSNSAAVIEMAAVGARIYAVTFLVNGINILSASFFTAISNAKLSVVISLLRGLVFVALGVFLLPKFFGIEGIWFTVPIAEFLTLGVSFYLVRRQLRQVKVK